MTELWFGISEKTQKEPYDPSVKETKTTNKFLRVRRHFIRNARIATYCYKKIDLTFHQILAQFSDYY